MQIRNPDSIILYSGENDTNTFFGAEAVFEDVSVSLKAVGRSIRLCLTADQTPVRYIRLRFNFKETEKRTDSIKILGDTYERSYGDLQWTGIVPERKMPWYMVDGDCVGITGAIDWKMNRQWLDLLARSGSPLFVSCKPGVLNDAEYAELKAAWAVNAVQENDCRPLDWMETICPEFWLIDGQEVHYHWYEETSMQSIE